MKIADASQMAGLGMASLTGKSHDFTLMQGLLSPSEISSVIHCLTIFGGSIMTTLTIRLDDQLDGQLSRLAERSHRTKSDLVREMLRREAALEELRQTRGLLKPYAERAGYLSDEDFFRDFS